MIDGHHVILFYCLDENVQVCDPAHLWCETGLLNEIKNYPSDKT